MLTQPIDNFISSLALAASHTQAYLGLPSKTSTTLPGCPGRSCRRWWPRWWCAACYMAGSSTVRCLYN